MKGVKSKLEALSERVFTNERAEPATPVQELLSQLQLKCDLYVQKIKKLENEKASLILLFRELIEQN